MDGITILNTIVQRPTECDGYIALCIIFGVIFAIGCCYMLYMAIDELRDRYKDILTVVMGFAMGLLCAAISVFLFVKLPYYTGQKETIIHALIDDSVSWKEVSERYELIRQDGQIYVLKEKGERNDPD